MLQAVAVRNSARAYRRSFPRGVGPPPSTRSGERRRVVAVVEAESGSDAADYGNVPAEEAKLL
jgi:hypothetical protein